ncbi:MAG TPA: Fic family protein, partial [Bacilli bacterium]
MFADIDKLKEVLESKRPVDGSLMKTIAQKFREEWTYHSNAIEGNTLTLQETAFFLREGLTIKGKTMQEHLEVINHAEAIDFLQEALQHRKINEGLIKELHAIIFQGVKVERNHIGGLYKTKDNHVLTPSGVIHNYTPFMQVPTEMEKLINWYEENALISHPIELSALFHYKFVSIHPFLDGNGRVGRLCMNFILMKYGFPPAIIKQENRLDYYLALEASDQGDSSSFIQLISS